MIKKTDKILNALLSSISIDSEDKSCIRINFIQVLKILSDYDIIVPQKIYESTLEKVLNERVVGKVPADNIVKYAIAQALLNTAGLLSISPEEIKQFRIKHNV